VKERWGKAEGIRRSGHESRRVLGRAKKQSGRKIRRKAIRGEKGNGMGVWQGVVMEKLEFHPSPPCPTLLRPAGGPSLKWPYGRFRDGLPIRRAVGGRLLPIWTSHTVRPWVTGKMEGQEKWARTAEQRGGR
jgi:hypothetical protein